MSSLDTPNFVHGLVRCGLAWLQKRIGESTGGDVTATDNVSAAPWLACRVASHICALPLGDIVETMRPLPLEPFPRAPAFVAGLAIIRGAPTPVVDMRALLGEPAASGGRFITVRVGERIAALAVDTVLGVHEVDAGRLANLPPLTRDIAGDAASAVASRDAQLMLFFQTTRIFPPSLVEALFKVRA